MFWDWVKKLIPGLSGIDRFTAVFTAAVGTITDGKMWRSLGWLLLGLVLIFVAVLWLIRAPLERKGEQAGEIAAMVA